MWLGGQLSDPQGGAAEPRSPHNPDLLCPQVQHFHLPRKEKEPGFSATTKGPQVGWLCGTAGGVAMAAVHSGPHLRVCPSLQPPLRVCPPPETPSEPLADSVSIRAPGMASERGSDPPSLPALDPPVLPVPPPAPAHPHPPSAMQPSPVTSRCQEVTAVKLQAHRGVELKGLPLSPQELSWPWEEAGWAVVQGRPAHCSQGTDSSTDKVTESSGRLSSCN